MKQIKILAIGNSFSNDATWHLWDMLNDLGIKATVGNLYIDGCSVDKHWDNAFSPEKAQDYTYYKNTEGHWEQKPARLEYALADDSWDIVTFQQASRASGQPDSLGKLDELMAFVRERVPKNCKFYWHMTWAYQSDAATPRFEIYDRDQIKMYNAICDTVENTVMKKPQIDSFIPVGTAIQNLRTSYLGDTLTRDGYHMNDRHGRFTAALTWACIISGAAPEEMKWRIAGENAFDEKDIAPICEAVKSAIENPFSRNCVRI